MKILFAAALLLAVACAEPIQRYHNATVYRLKATNRAALDLVASLDEEVDFWREPNKLNLEADVMLTSAQKHRILKLFQDNGIKYEVMIPDVEQSIENERREQARAFIRASIDVRPRITRDTEAIANFWTAYQRYDQHVAFVQALVDQNAGLVSQINFGTSYEGRALVAAVIGANSNANKPVIWIEGGIHAREWISPATVTYFAQQLVNGYNAGTQDYVDLLNYFDFYIVPILNVDGYEFTHTSTRLWRKTRRPNSGSTCIGTDPNRNWGYDWAGSGASSNPCSETYYGDSAFSEPETKAESDYILSLGSRVKAYLAVHSYGQYMLYPWSSTTALCPDDAEINRVATLAVAALNEVTPTTRYTIGSTSNVLYNAAGGSHDWAYASAGVTYSYTPELRDTGTYGFQLPASQLVPTATETSAGFLALAKAVKDKLGA